LLFLTRLPVFFSRHTDRIDGIPSLGWETTIAYLILPCLLVVSQFASMQLMQPKTDDPAQQQGNAILKFLPLMIGWFSLNVPSALCIYWITNNVVTTASSVFIRNNVAAAAATAGPKSTTVQTSAASKSVFAPPREKPSGFGASPSAGSDGVKPITSIDAEIEEELDDDAEDDDEDHDDSPTSSEPVKKKRGKNGKKAKKAKN
jgi:YidC/Oxa1 family membrane protein insertase